MCEFITRNDIIVMSKVSTHDNLVDMTTKSFPIAKFNYCLNLVDKFSSLELLCGKGGDGSFVARELEFVVSSLHCGIHVKVEIC